MKLIEDMNMDTTETVRLGVAVKYGDWSITYDPPPIPLRMYDYSFVHKNYDGAPDAYDDRCGQAGSYDEAKRLINEMENEGAGSEYGSGSGDGAGFEDGSGPGDRVGSGYGSEDGSGDGSGYGDGAGSEYGSGSGV